MVSKDYFLAVHEKPSTSITCLKDANGVEIKDRPGLEELCMDFYSKLYVASVESVANTAAMEAILSTITNTMPHEHQAQFSVPLSAEELREAAKAMASERSPEPDGLSVTFFHKILGYHRSRLHPNGN